MRGSDSSRKSEFRRAVGLLYDEAQEETPVISVKGQYFEADELVRIANRYGVPVIERKELAQALDKAEEGQEIPESLYEAVAVILSRLGAARE